MELPGSNYLYTIITVSITYAGFAALLMIFRQIIGGGMSSYDVYLIRTVLMRSFIVAISAMMPPLLALPGVLIQASMLSAPVGFRLVALPQFTRLPSEKYRAASGFRTAAMMPSRSDREAALTGSDPATRLNTRQKTVATINRFFTATSFTAPDGDR